jgi:hypothetical protein
MQRRTFVTIKTATIVNSGGVRSVSGGMKDRRAIPRLRKVASSPGPTPPVHAANRIARVKGEKGPRSPRNGAST